VQGVREEPVVIVQGVSKEPTLRYKNVEEMLSRIFNVPEEGRGAFRARLRHLRNLGIPEVPKTGSGTQVPFTREQLMEMLIALELSRLGIAPRFVGDIAAQVLRKVREAPALAKAPKSAAHHEMFDPLAGKKIRRQVVDPGVAWSWSITDLDKGYEDLAKGYEGLRALAFAKRGRGLFVMMYPEDDLTSDGRHWDVGRLDDHAILKVIEDHPRVAFINLGSSLKVLDEYLQTLQ
jgi:hypothetical protein